MASIVVRRVHNLGIDGVKKILDKLAKDPVSNMISWKWKDSEHLVCEGKQGITRGCTGDLVFDDKSLTLQLNLPATLSFFKGMVEKEINKQIDSLLK